MPKFSKLGITAGDGFNGSFIDTKVLIERRVALNIEKYEIRPSCLQGSQLLMLQLSIGGRYVLTWNGSTKLAGLLAQATAKEQQGEVCFPIEDCIIVEGDDGGYGLQDADQSCLHPTAAEVDELISQSRRRGSWRKRK